jgi:uncharacterized protein with HEPN domain
MPRNAAWNDMGRVWLMIEDDLPPLKKAVQAALEQLRKSN